MYGSCGLSSGASVGFFNSAAAAGGPVGFQGGCTMVWYTFGASTLFEGDPGGKSSARVGDSTSVRVRRCTSGADVFTPYSRDSRISANRDNTYKRCNSAVIQTEKARGTHAGEAITRLATVQYTYNKHMHTQYTAQQGYTDLGSESARR